ncbi:hypothetical protein [Candidatus Igneacidithiobacillus taiwanensis]|uniref:hypothetical protein n=1 Tax=Candidatus Igneacidithiobacillus taiwanensis TaxID=1945924 RepID=UPI00289FD19C|nr:hypothetical protein [Candidatus Igneacidithiobacillus taiwanensis]
MNPEEGLEYARRAPLDRDYLVLVERLVMDQIPLGTPSAYAEDWEETERLIARLADRGVGTRIEHLFDEQGMRWRAYLDWQDPISFEWQMVEQEEQTAARAVTRAALVWYYQQELSAANSQPPDPWSYFEVVERLSMIRDLLNRSLEDHPVLAAEVELQKRFRDAQEKLNALYELAGQIFDQRLDAPKPGTMH